MAATTVASLTSRPLAISQRASFRTVKAQRVTVRAQAHNQDAQDVVIKSAALASFAGSLLYSGSAQAAVEVANIAAGDGRSGLLFLPLTAAIGWVLFNIAGPAKNQFDNMGSKGVAAGLGLGAASLLAAQSADAAEVMQLAAGGDGRGALLLFPLAAAVGWVLFNIAGPAKNQFDNMGKKAVIGGLGLSALFAAQSADAAEVMQLAAGGDGRGALLLFPLAAAVGWVLFNIAGPAKNQFDNMGKKAVVGGLGLSALFAAQSADAAEVMQLAAGGDGRGALLLFPLAAAVGWVLFNIAGPAKNQFDNMGKKAVVAGLGAASLFAAQSADAAEVMQLAAGGDGRGSLLLFPLAAAIGWVLFNIAGPAKNQFDNMGN